MISNIGLTIVSYGDRYNYCHKVIEECLRQGIIYINVYGNKCSQKSSLALKILCKKKNINYFSFSQSMPMHELFTHSHGIFQINKNIKYFMILDDDNLPLENCFINLIKAKNKIIKKSNKFALYCTRHSMSKLDSICLKGSLIKKYPNNSYIGFDLLSILKIKILPLFSKKKEGEQCKTNFGPWGGMFLEMSIPNLINFKKAKYFLYADDINYSLNIDKKGIKQYLIGNANIKDLVLSNVTSSNYFISNLKKKSFYFRIKSHHNLSQSLKNNLFIYGFNKFSFYITFYYKFIIGLLVNTKRTKQRLLVFKLALRNSKYL